MFDKFETVIKLERKHKRKHKIRLYFVILINSLTIKTKKMDLTIKAGTKFSGHIEATPTDAPITHQSLENSAQDIVSLSPDGNGGFTGEALKEGTATLTETVKTKGGKMLTATATITVEKADEEPDEATGIEIIFDEQQGQAG